MMVFLVLFLFIALALLVWQASLLISAIFGAPTVYAENDAIIKAFEAANLKKDETVLDLGCGNAKALIYAAEKFGAEGIGVEISPFYFLKAKLNVISSGRSNQIKIIFGNLKKSGKFIKQSDVVFLYLFPKLLDEIEDELFDNLSPKARIVTVGFHFKNHHATNKIPVMNRNRRSFVYLYETAEKRFLLSF